jgi:hypothetical protein
MSMTRIRIWPKKWGEKRTEEMFMQFENYLETFIATSNVTEKAFTADQP